MVLRVVNIILCICFIIFAALQYNDPDPYVWIPIYLYAAVLCGLAARNKFFPNLYLLGILIYAVYAGAKFFEKEGVLDWINQHHAESIAASMKATTPWIEETREFFGLVILIIALLINYVYARRRGVN